MDKKEAIEVLNQLLDQIPELRQLEYDDEKYRLWYYEVCDTLEGIFGRDSVEYKRFAVKIRSWQRSASEAEKRERHLTKLNEHETDLRSIIKRLEGQKALDNTMEAVSAAPKAFVANNGEKRPFDKAKEIEIQVDSLATLDSIIASVASELYFKNCYFEVRSADSQRTNSSARFDVFIIGPTTSKTPIGTFTLHWLGSNRAMLRVPPRSRWGDSLTGEEKIRMGLSGSQYDEYFGQFIESLEERLTHYNLKLTSRKRLWRGSKEIIGIWNKIKP